MFQFWHSITIRYKSYIALVHYINKLICITDFLLLFTANIYVVNTTASSALNMSDPKFARYYILNPNYYYHVYTISVPVTGYYSIMSVSAINLYGYIYYPNFNANDSTDDLAAFDDNSGGNQQFQIIMNLAVNRTYTLVVTTTVRNTTGSYTIVVSGLNSVLLNRVQDPNPATNTTAATTATTAAATTATTAATDDNGQTVVIIIIVVVVTVAVLIIVFIALGLQIW